MVSNAAFPLAGVRVDAAAGRAEAPAEVAIGVCGAGEAPREAHGEPVGDHRGEERGQRV